MYSQVLPHAKSVLTDISLHNLRTNLNVSHVREKFRTVLHAISHSSSMALPQSIDSFVLLVCQVFHLFKIGALNAISTSSKTKRANVSSAPRKFLAARRAANQDKILNA